MDPTTKGIHESLVELERLAEDILQNKGTMIDLDRKRNDNRVALRQIDKSGYDKTWIAMGSTFFRLETNHAKKILQEDQKETEKKINETRNEMKQKTMKMQEVEGKPILKGFNLKPLNAEIEAMLPNRPY